MKTSNAKSPPIERLAADSHALASAIAGRAARKVFTVDPPIDIITTTVQIDELEGFLPEFAQRYGLDLGELRAAFAVLPVRVFSESDYISHKDQARKYLSRRDPSDVDLAALALKFGVPVWSNDNDFKELSEVKVYTTAQLLAALGIFSK